MADQTTTGISMGKVSIFVLAALIAGFLVGFILQYSRTSGYSQLKSQQQLSQLRDELTLAHLQVMENNFGQAQQHASKFFNDLRLLIATTKDEQVKSNLWPMMQRRDDITKALAQASPASEKQIREVLNNIYAITRTEEAK